MNDFERGQREGVEFFLMTEGPEDNYDDVIATMRRQATSDETPAYWRGVLYGLLAEFGCDV